MQINPTNQVSSENKLATLIRSKSKVGVVIGFLATAISLPFLGSKGVSADDPSQTKPSRNHSRILTEEDRNSTDLLRSYFKGKDLRAQEIEWANKVWPTIRTRLINMYKAEREDNIALKKKEITEKDRKVKVCYTDFVPPGMIGDDGGSEISLHVVKYYDDKQADGTVLRTYVNEHWPINEETGGILPTEVFRVRTQVFKGSLNEQGAENLFVTDLLQAIWGDNADGSKAGAPYAYFYRQHLYDSYNLKEKKNPINQLQVPISSPLKCMSCHNSKATFTQDIYLKPWQKRTNFGAITPDEGFNKAYNEQRGYLKYKAYLEQRVKDGKTKQNYADAILRNLMDSTSMENPYIVESLKESQSIPWLDGDSEATGYHNAYGFTYTKDKKTYIKAGFDRFKDELFINLWWSRNSFQLGP